MIINLRELLVESFTPLEKKSINGLTKGNSRKLTRKEKVNIQNDRDNLVEKVTKYKSHPVVQNAKKELKKLDKVKDKEKYDKYKKISNAAHNVSVAILNSKGNLDSKDIKNNLIHNSYDARFGNNTETAGDISSFKHKPIYKYK